MAKQREVRVTQLAGSVWVRFLGKVVTIVTGFVILWVSYFGFESD